MTGVWPSDTVDNDDLIITVLILVAALTVIVYDGLAVSEISFYREFRFGYQEFWIVITDRGRVGLVV